MIILNYRPDIKSGSEHMLALLFDMNKLWEEYIYRMLKRIEDPWIKVKVQTRKKFWEQRTIRPDIVVSYSANGPEKQYVIDTKWKIIEHANPSDEDLKQMFVYNIYWEAEHSILLYPNTLQQPAINGDFAQLQVIPRGNQCTLGFVEVIKNNTLNPDVGTEILALIRRV